MGNLARFTINGVASTPAGFDASALQVLAFALEAPSGIARRWTLSVYDPAQPGAPLASLSAPQLTLVGATSGSVVDAASVASTITCTLPAGPLSASWIVRSVIDGGIDSNGSPNSDLVFERLIAARSLTGVRKTVAGEAQQYSPRGAADAQNELADIPSAGSAVPFRARYFVDPAFSGAHTGSAANPFASVTSAIAAAVALALSSAIFVLPGGATTTENVTFPATGGDWEIQGSTSGIFRPTISGNVVCNSTPQSGFVLRDVNVSGNISGLSAAAGGCFLTLINSDIGGTVTLTRSGALGWFFQCDGRANLFSFFGFGGGVSGAISVDGQSLTWAYRIGSTLSFTSISASVNCTHLGDISIGSGGSLRLFGAGFVGARTITGTAGAVNVQMDEATETGFAGTGSSGLVLVNVNLTTVGRQSKRLTVTGNAGANALTPVQMPTGQYEIVATAELLAAGTAGTMGVNVVYTDFSGTVVTEALTSGGSPMGLSVTGTVGSKARGALLFSHKGGAAISFTVTGVTTAGSFSANTCVTVRRLE